nr:nitrate/nitrite transporter NrtS [Vibrio profundi]
MNKTLVKRAAVIAVIVGSLLNVINQYEAIFGGDTIEWLKAALTFCVPFVVSLVSSYITLRDVKRNQRESR